MKENVPIIKISKGLINTTKIIRQLEECEQYVNVDFTEDGKIPDFIEFDRDDENLYITVEEILSIYVNSKKSIEVDDENISEFPNKEIQSSENDLKHIFPLLMFKKGTVKREDTTGRL